MGTFPTSLYRLAIALSAISLFNKPTKLRRCVSRVHFAKIPFGKIHFGNQSLKAVSHSFRKVYLVPWSNSKDVPWGSRGTDIGNLKVLEADLPTNLPMTEEGARNAYASNNKITTKLWAASLEVTSETPVAESAHLMGP